MYEDKNTPKSLTIKEWAEEDRPREKLMHLGKKKLTNAELLAIIIGSGNREETAVELSQRILNSVNNNIAELTKLNYNDLMNNFKGIGEAKAINIVAALELANRKTDFIEEKPIISDAKSAYQALLPEMADLEYETFWVLLLSNSQRLVKKHCISEGGWVETSIDLKKLFKLVLENNCTKIIIAHNHPSGLITPSNSDKIITERISQASKILSIQTLDHIIVTNQAYYSFAENGLM
ncbi:MAG: DNA repair protein RadC [Bacteroidales bacterium]|jgi:DNA repair protein RadC|nr:DNA repair protein RadC [Bacteroidales bacterium]MDY0054489.1 DNA repair protein RadC [Bacteroidales bacterium]